MARKKQTDRPGYGKLLEVWTAPPDAGSPIGCVATTFTFSPAFFEEECLTRFLQLESDPTEDGPAYLIEREEKLAQLVCAAAVVDQHHCVGERSLRWDLISARLARGLLHAKVSLLFWSDLVRVIVASANLTEDGYRRNLETFGVLDFRRGKGAPRALLREVTQFLRQAVDLGTPGAEAAAPATGRLKALLDKVDSISDALGVGDDAVRRESVATSLVFSGGDYPPVLEQLASIWLASSPPKSAYVLSPFFDPPEAENRPARELWDRLRKRGEATVSYYLTAEDVPGEEAIFLHAPESIVRAGPSNRPDAATLVCRLTIEDNRPLHAKILELADDRWTLNLVGSSNFTSAGLGLSTAPNIEANLAYRVDSERDPHAQALLEAAFPETEGIPSDVEVRWKPRVDDGEDSPPEIPLLPPFFLEAVYAWGEKSGGYLTLSLGEGPPPGWRVFAEDVDGNLYDESRWVEGGRPREVSLPWKPLRPPSGLLVAWRGSEAGAWWPVNVRGSADLPPPQDLRDLPLDVLISILSSARPLHRVLADYLRRRADAGLGQAAPAVIDPHKRVDTSQFLLQRTRRISAALLALRSRLERPVPTAECLAWRLHGPVGVLALAKAVVREAKSDGERGFLLSEIALELGRVKPVEAPGCLSSSLVLEEVRKAIGELRALMPDASEDEPENLNAYIKSVFESLSV
jgi:hypothetical protein